MKETNKQTPPYIGVNKLNDTIDIISKKSYSEVSPIIFESNGFGKLDALLAIRLLKFLGVLDEQGNPNNEVMSKLRLTGDERKKAFADIVRISYSGLFETIDEPQNLSSEALDNAFLAHYPDLSRRVLKSVKPVFFRLCELAGLREEGIVKSRAGKSNLVRKIPKENAKFSKTSGSKEITPVGFHVKPIVQGKMSISIKEEDFLRMDLDDDMNNAWRAVLKSAHKFADEYLKDKTATENEEAG